MAKNLLKYERQYQEGRGVCGPPSQQFVDFFNSLNEKDCRVLDLGCGQGRDALFIARKGHRVVGVDVSETGISQMLEDARKEDLNVDGMVADIVEFEPEGEYDVILLDRVLHMLKDNDDRLAVLETVSRHTKLGGFVLIADTPKNKGVLVKFFEDKHENWEKRVDNKGFLFLQRKRI
jgi:2-polyprenyl-3-methyl-5-hydroxy-6-metoxy-1,4-benzoquinol methylase